MIAAGSRSSEARLAGKGEPVVLVLQRGQVWVCCLLVPLAVVWARELWSPAAALLLSIYVSPSYQTRHAQFIIKNACLCMPG